jgi:DNA modification methylase
VKDAKILVGHCVQVLDGLPANSIHACITSPPYYRLRQYDAVADWPEITYAPLPGLPEIAIPAMCCELGLEQDLAHYVGHLVHVFRSVRRVLRPEGTLWLNLGDGWASTGKRGASRDDFNARWNGSAEGGKAGEAFHYLPAMNVPTGLQRKDLCGVPWRVAFALQADGWLLRSEVIWAKKNCMPDPTEDRPTRSHETVFQLAKRLDYFHDGFAIREDHTMKPQRRPNGHKRRRPGVLLPEHTFSGTARDDPGVDGHPAGRNARSVWEISTTPFKEAHFAVMPVELAQRCVLACTSERGVCPACGAPHVRVVERAKLEDAAREHSKFGDGHVMAENRRRHVSLAGDAYQEQRDDRPPFTVRWDAGCACAAGDPVPATVLDPFSGAATTAVAALRAGRSFVGVECNEAYADMSRKRLTRDAGQDLMFTREGLLPPRS